MNAYLRRPGQPPGRFGYLEGAISNGLLARSGDALLHPRLYLGLQPHHDARLKVKRLGESPLAYVLPEGAAR
jgi:hypothetical protein